MRSMAILGAALLPAVLMGCAGATRRGPNDATVAAITPADLGHRLRIIADDSMMGRASGSEGDYKAAEYVASEFRRLGLEPAGENGTYFQTVPFWMRGVDPSSDLQVDGTHLLLGRDFLPTSLAASRSLEGVDVVYGGSLGDTGTLISPEQAADKLIVIVPADASLRNLRLNPGRFNQAKAIAIVDAYDYPAAMSDLQVFSAQFGLPAPTSAIFQIVYANGRQPRVNATGTSRPPWTSNGRMPWPRGRRSIWSRPPRPAMPICCMPSPLPTRW